MLNVPDITDREVNFCLFSNCRIAMSESWYEWVVNKSSRRICKFIKHISVIIEVGVPIACDHPVYRTQP